MELRQEDWSGLYQARANPACIYSHGMVTVWLEPYKGTSSGRFRDSWDELKILTFIILCNPFSFVNLCPYYVPCPL